MLQTRLKELILKATVVDHSGDPSSHPIAVINAVKNILSDARDENHEDILNKVENWLESLTILNSKSDILKDIRKEAIGEPIFVSDLTEAVQDGNRKQALSYAAQIHLSAMSPTLVQELITEVYLQDSTYFAPFCYHWLRANHFVGSDKHIWDFAPAGLIYVGKRSLSGPAFPSEMPDLTTTINLLLNNQDFSNLVVLMAGLRLLENDYVRSPKFKNEISYWMHECLNKKLQESSSNAGVVSAMKTPSFIKTLNELVTDKMTETGRIMELEAFRAVFKMFEKNEAVFPGNAFNQWMKQ